VTRAEALDVAIATLYAQASTADYAGGLDYAVRLNEAIGVLHEMNEEFDA
jgi:hypothetical protein